ncbi:hypothetical protein RB195_002408 [Necator americanus]|uniref:Uncharacterized protein n=1 Tax=Necator americanus TaxID=51031 RepID=A0ABR1DJW6_NECAM
MKVKSNAPIGNGGGERIRKRAFAGLNYFIRLQTSQRILLDLKLSRHFPEILLRYLVRRKPILKRFSKFDLWTLDHFDSAVLVSV